MSQHDFRSYNLNIILKNLAIIFIYKLDHLNDHFLATSCSVVMLSIRAIMFGCGFMDLSGTAATNCFSYLLMREKEKGDQLLVSSLQKALNYALMLVRAASQNTDGLVFEQTNAVTFPCACYIL